MTDDEQPETPAGVPSTDAQERFHWIMAGAVGIPLLGGILYLVVGGLMATTLATTIAKIPVTDLDVAARQPVQIEAGAKLTFALTTGYTYTGKVDVMLTVALMRGAEVAKTTCNMKSLGNGGGSGNGANTWYGDAGWTCKLDAPADGADTIRVEVTKRGPGTLALREPVVLVKRR